MERLTSVTSVTRVTRVIPAPEPISLESGVADGRSAPETGFQRLDVSSADPADAQGLARQQWEDWHARLLAAIAAEREACARLAERFDASRLAVAIRARSELSPQARALNGWAEGHLVRYGIPWPGEDADR